MDLFPKHEQVRGNLRELNRNTQLSQIDSCSVHFYASKLSNYGLVQGPSNSLKAIILTFSLFFRFIHFTVLCLLLKVTISYARGKA